MPAPGPRRRVLVVGGGPAGLAAAVTASARGHDVHLVERADHLGGRLALAATAPGREEWAHLVDDLAAEVAGAGVAVHLRTPLHGVDGADVVVLATGAAPALPPWGHDRLVDVTDVLTGRAYPDGDVVVVDDGGAHAATSTAELLARRGARVTVLTGALVAAGALGPTLERERWRRRAAALGIAQRTDRVVLAAHGTTVDVLEHLTGARETWHADWVVYAGPGAPVLPEPLPDGVPVVRVGDCVAPRDAGAAVREGHDAAVAIDALTR